MTIIDIAIKNLLRRKTKAAFILAGLVIGVATVVAVISFSDTMTYDINHKLEKYGANILIVPQTDRLTLSYGGMALGGVSFDIQPIRQAELAKINTIKNAANVAAVGPILLGAVQIQSASVLMAGIDFQAAGILKPWWKITGQQPTNFGLLIGAEAARVLGIALGDTVMINQHTLTAVGILDATGSQDDQLIFSTLETAQAVLEKPGQVSMVEVAALCKDCPIDEMVAQIAEKLPSAKVMAIQQVVKGRMEALAQFKRFSYGLSVVVVIIGGLVVLVTLMGSVKERTEEIGIFRAIGFRQSQVRRLIFIETSVISTLAGIMGYLVGMGGLWVGLYLFKADSVHALSMNATLGAGAVVLSVGVGVISGLYPATMAARMDPNQALKSL